MKSEIITISSNEESIEKALSLTEEFGKDLKAKEQLRLRLLAEEMMNLISSITGEFKSEYYIENEGNHFFLHLHTDTMMYAEKRKELMDVSSKKENAAAKGMIGKLREVFELALLPKDERAARESHIGMMGLADPTAVQTMANEEWTMSNYISSVNELEDSNEFAQEAKNELERSIIANIAKEVTIAIVGDDVKMTVEWDAE